MWCTQLNEAKKKADDNQLELEETQNGRRKLDQELKALQERLEELKAENAKLARGKKKVQGEVSSIYSAEITVTHTECSW